MSSSAPQVRHALPSLPFSACRCVAWSVALASWCLACCTAHVPDIHVQQAVHTLHACLHCEHISGVSI